MGAEYQKTKSGLKFHINNDGSISQSQVNIDDIRQANNLYATGKAFLFGHGEIQDYSKALIYFKQAAELGHVDALERLGLLYSIGIGVPKDNLKSIEYYKQAISKGSKTALVSLGIMYFVPDANEDIIDYDKAFGYFTLAAQYNVPSAYYYLGCCYLDGLGVSIDTAKAIEYFTLGTEQGDANAQYYLGRCYYDGIIVPTNRKRAFQYLQDSAQQGNKSAIEFLQNKHPRNFTPIIIIVLVVALFFAILYVVKNHPNTESAKTEEVYETLEEVVVEDVVVEEAP